jgi:hypothetical protein
MGAAPAEAQLEVQLFAEHCGRFYDYNVQFARLVQKLAGGQTIFG